MENLNFTFFNKWSKPSAAVGAGGRLLRAGALLRCSHLSGAGGAKQRFRAIETKQAYGWHWAGLRLCISPVR